MLLKLVAADQITSARARGIAERVGEINPAIPPRLLASYKDKLLGLGKDK
jgi:hypothetical protein